MSLTHWLVVIVVALLLFGRGKISEMMGDLAKGIKSFKKGMAEDDDAPVPQVQETAEYSVIEHQPAKKAPARKAPAKRAKAKG